MDNSNRITHTFEEVIFLNNLFAAWREFRRGKRNRKDVQEFELNLEDNIFALYADLKNQTYRHGAYHTFHIYDPKHRIVSKALVRDRIVHHLIFNQLYEVFDSSFAYHSYSSRLEKGTHRAVVNLEESLRQASRNYSETIFVLKCDVKKFFASISHQKLVAIIKNKITDPKLLWLIEEIIGSFISPVDKILERERELKGEFIKMKKGVPIGNVTSQIFANIYLNELDQFIKHQLKVKYYFRYADDFVIVHNDVLYLLDILKSIGLFLRDELNLELHPGKVSIKKFSYGVDFLGYVILPHYKVLRTTTRNRMFKKLSAKRKLVGAGAIKEESYNQSLQSYLGILKHCRGYGLGNKIRNI